MRKRLIMVLLCAIVCMVSGCGKNSTEAEEEEENGIDEVIEVEAAQIPGVGIAEADEEADGAENLNDAQVGRDPSAFYASADLLWVLPKSFRALDGEEGVYVSRDYPKDASTVTYVIAESEDNISDVSQEEFQKMMEADFLDAYGDQVDINITNYEKMKVSKRSGLRIDMNYEFKGEEYEQIAVMLYNGNESHIINYTQEKDGKWKDEFESSISSFNFTE